MTSFASKIREKMESHAYCDGLNAFQCGYFNKIVKSPYPEGSKADQEWLDGFYDAWFMRIATGGSYEPRDRSV